MYYIFNINHSKKYCEYVNENYSAKIKEIKNPKVPTRERYTTGDKAYERDKLFIESQAKWNKKYSNSKKQFKPLQEHI